MFEIVREGDFQYYESKGDGQTVILLHGLLGALSNFEGIINQFGRDYNVVLPILPIFDLPLKKSGLMGLLNYIESFVEYKGYDAFHILGNSLGGHLAQLYTLANPTKVISLTLTGSSGLFENAMGSSFPKRGNYDYIKNKAEETFYDPKVATKELVDEMFGIINDRNKALRIIVTAKTAIRHNLAERLGDIHCPTLLIWGKNDIVTPLFVGEKFQELIPNAHLDIIDKCGHAPMMEHPDKFNVLLSRFLNGLAVTAA